MGIRNICNIFSFYFVFELIRICIFFALFAETVPEELGQESHQGAILTAFNYCPRILFTFFCSFLSPFCMNSIPLCMNIIALYLTVIFV